jgi:hypothetical protein
MTKRYDSHKPDAFRFTIIVRAEGRNANRIALRIVATSMTVLTLAAKILLLLSNR